MDDLDVPGDLDAFVILGDEHDLSIFDEHIPMAAGGGVAVTATQYLGASCGLPAGDVHQHQQQPAEPHDLTHLILYPLAVVSTLIVAADKSILQLLVALDPLIQPFASIDG